MTTGERRKRLGLKQEDVAERAQCSVQYVRMIEAGYVPRTENRDTYDRVLAVLDNAERTAA